MKEGVMSESGEPDCTAPDLEAVLDVLGLPAVMLDARARIVRANAAWRAAGWGAPGDVYPGSDSGALEHVRQVCEGGAERAEALVEESALGGAGYQLRVVCVRRTPRLCLATHLPLPAASDVLLRLRQELQTARQQFVHAQKLESVGRLSSGVAHDFNNMLTSIICFTRFVVDDLVVEDPRRADLIEVLKAADHAARLTNQLLAFSRRKPLQPVAINVNEAVTSVGRVLRRTLGEHVELVIEPSDEPVWICCDPGQFDQLLFNLAIHAKDELGADGGSIRVKLGRVSLADANAAALPAGDYVEVVFSHGVATVQAAPGPESLGLAASRAIAEQARGALLAHTEASSASQRVLLPAAEVRGGARRVSITPLRLRGVALVVEDQPAILRTMVRALATAGLTVLEANSAEDALGLLDTRPDVRLDLVVADVVLPRMSGPRLVEQLRVRFPRLPALFVSGYIDEEVVASAHNAESSAFVSKPFTGRQLAVRAASLLGHRSASLTHAPD
jgi:two-component system, cell cycle sensor histidine kinase and response regulator CckA